MLVKKMFLLFFQHQNMGNKSQCHVLLDQLLSHYPAETREKWEKFTEDQLGN